jgi:hypothetical protein
MKKLYVFILIFLLAACSKEFQGINYKFRRAGGGLAKAAYVQRYTSALMPAPQDASNYISPDEAIVACSRIVFPSLEDAQAIFDANSDMPERTQDIHISQTEFDSLLPRAIIAYNASTHNPKIIALDEAAVMYLDTLDIADEDRFWGMILQTVYFEFAFQDFRLRWYCNDSDPYRTNDVLLKRSSENNWKFAYNHCAVDTALENWNETYTLFLSDSRRENIYYWVTGHEPSKPTRDTLTHLVYRYDQDLENAFFLNGATSMIIFGKTSTEDAGGGFGRLKRDIIGFSINVIYNLEPGASGTFGLMYNFSTAEEGVLRFSDLQQETLLPKQLTPIKSIEFEVEYVIAEFNPGE